MFLYGAQLEEFGRVEAEKRRRKTITLLQGTISFRTTPARLVIEDMDTALTTAKAVALETETTETVTNTHFDRGAFRARAAAIREETGEILPGIRQTEASETFNVKFPAET